MLQEIKTAFTKLCEEKHTRYALAAVFGIFAGLLNGFLGSGGGIILIFALGILMPKQDEKDRFATAVLSMIPMSAVSVCYYLGNGGMNATENAHYFASALFGGVLGAYLMTKISPTLLRTIFALLMLWAGFRALT